MNDEEKIVTNHLPEPALEVAKTADLVLELEEFKIPVHSACLGIHSSVLRDMFQEFQGISTLSKESLAVQEAFSGFEVHDVVFYLAMNYRMENFDFLRTNLDLMSKETAPKGVDLAGVMRIAAKLDAPRILKACTKRVKDHADLRAEAGNVHWLGVAVDLNLVDLQQECAAHILVDIVN